MKRLILIIIVCCRALGWCHANTQTETDSLYRVTQSLPHDSTRLEMFKRLAQIEQLTPKCITPPLPPVRRPWHGRPAPRRGRSS